MFAFSSDSLCRHGPVPSASASPDARHRARMITMSVADFVLSRFGAAFGWAVPKANAGSRTRAPGAARPKNRLLAALEAHTYRQIELALGERAAEFNRAVCENRARETRKEQMK